MKRLIHCATAILAAVLAVFLFAGVVRSSALTDRAGAVPRSAVDQPADTHRLQDTPEFSRTRLVTITVGSSTVPLTPGLNSRWQIDIAQQEFFTGTISLPADAGDVTATLINGDLSIDYAGATIYISNSQGLYYEYRTDQQAQRFGNQILISHSHRYNRPLHYIGTVNFTEPYHYVGSAGYVPTQTGATQLHWDESFTGTQLHEFTAETWLVHPDLIRPDLQILTATLSNDRDRVYVTADIRNNGPITAGAPAYLNLYDRLAPSVPPTGALDLTDGWCRLIPFSFCGGGSSNPLPSVAPGQTVVFAAEFELSPVNGQHDIYLFVDALGGSQGLNVESSENNNFFLAGSLIRRGAIVFLPLIQRE